MVVLLTRQYHLPILQWPLVIVLEKLTIAALNGPKVLGAAYLTAPCREKLYTTAGSEFSSEVGKMMLLVRALYGLKRSGAAFCSFWTVGQILMFGSSHVLLHVADYHVSPCHWYTYHLLL